MLRLVRTLFLGIFGATTVSTFMPIVYVEAARGALVRVLLHEGSDIRVRGDSSKSLFLNGAGFSRKRIKRIRILKVDRGLKVFLNGERYQTTILPRQAKLRISSNDSRGVWFGGRRYRGELRIHSSFNNKILVVNHLGLEKYIASVVGGEMPKNWPLPALEAQAVAARTYALRQRKLRKQILYDITSNEASQVYLGLEAETPSTSRAVRNTRNIVMTQKGRLINAVFHSCSGGLTEFSGAVWKNQLPYLVSVKDFDKSCPNYQWEIRFSEKQLKRAFPEIKGLNKINLIKVSSTGRVLQASLEGPGGLMKLNGKQIRRRLKLKSTLFRFQFVPNNPFIDSYLNEIKSSALDLKLGYKFPSEVMRRSFGFWRDWSTGGEKYFSKKLPFLKAPPDPNNILLSLPSIKSKDDSLALNKLPPLPKESANKNTTLFISGFGAGHGVGMSQWGAYEMANEGAKYRKILSHYYNKINIKTYR